MLVSFWGKRVDRQVGSWSILVARSDVSFFLIGRGGGSTRIDKKLV